jgi:hypothetical protein
MANEFMNVFVAHTVIEMDILLNKAIARERRKT